MKPVFVAASIVACLLASIGLGAASAQGEARGAGGDAVFKAVIHVNFDDAERQKHGLKNVTNMLNEVKEGDIEVVCHGKGLSLLVKEKTPAADDVARLMQSGVKFAACENTMREKGIKKEELLPGITTVPSGAVEVVRKQQEGYGYFKP